MTKFIEEQTIDDMRKLLKANRTIKLAFKKAMRAFYENKKYSFIEIIFGVKKIEEVPQQIKGRYKVVACDDVNIDINNWYKHIHNFNKN